jgi:hypothetical protein
MRIVSLCLICAVFAVVLALPAAAVNTQSVSIVLNPGDNWVASPVVPFDPTPASVFSGIDINNNLTFWDPLQQQSIVYDAAHPGNYPAILMGEGYIVRNTGTTAITCQYGGVNIDDTDLYLSLPGSESGGGGMNWIGITSTSDMLFDDLYVLSMTHDTCSVAQAAQMGLMDAVWTTMNSATQTIERVGASGQQGVDTHWLRAGHMYKVQTYESTLAIIAPHPVPEPTTLPALFCALGGVATMLRRSRRRN